MLHTRSPRSARQARTAVVAATLALFLASCGGSEGTATGPGAKSGSLLVTIAGLPAGGAAAVNVSGPEGFARSLGATATLSGLSPGLYTIAAGPATIGTDRYDPTVPTPSVTVTAGASASATISYAIGTGAIAVSVSGIPSSAPPPALAISGPGGFARTVTAPATVGGLEPGTYHVTAATIEAAGHTWAPGAASQVVIVQPGTTPVPARVDYAVTTGAILAHVTGLPAGQGVAISLAGPNGAARTVAAGELATNLVPGTWTLSGPVVTVGADRYQPVAPAEVQVAPSTTPQVAQLYYGLATGTLALTIAGLPASATASVQVTGPAGFSQSLTASGTLAGLAPGTYTVTASEVTSSGLTYGVAGPLNVAVAASSTPATATVTYAISRGSLSLVVTGLPQTLSASVAVTGPGGYTTTATSTAVLNGLKPGTYTVSPGQVTSGLHTYAGTPANAQVTVAASATPAQATVTYAIATGLLSISVSGLPPDVNADITVTGPAGYSTTRTGTSLLSGLAPGAYTIAAATVQGGATSYGANPASQVVNVPASTTATPASVTYVASVGALAVGITGLPGGVSANVRITGPGAFDQTLTSSQTLSGLLQGTYSVTASSVTSGGNTYSVSPATQSVGVTTGATASVTVPYVQTGGPPPPPPAPNLTIDGMHVQQVTQTYTGTVPLVSGQDGLLRVFVKASASNTLSPTVRVRLYQGATLASTITINAPGGSVPTTISQTPLSASWNTLIPAALMVPGLRILADVDPTNAIVESSDADNAFPVNGTPLVMDVRTLPTFSVRFVPVTQSVNGLTGGVTAGNSASYLASARQLFPLGTVDADVRVPFTTNAPVLQSNDGNGAWSQILGEISALRVADGSTRYYAGIAKVTYGSGIAGMGYVPGRATLSWDHLPSASGVVAHELGHNFGRFHAPCGGAGGPDPSYPYAGGVIGVYGLDLASSTLKAPTLTDLMGYCNNNWISDYTYNAVMNHRIANPMISAARTMSGGTSPRGLLVWGRIRQGQLILEPAFEVDAPAALPQRPGANRLQAFGPLGETLLDLSFEGERPADAPDATAQHFAFVIPMDMLGGVGPSRLRFSAAGRSVERRSSGRAPGTRQPPSAQAEGTRGVRVRWTDPEVQGVLVRDAQSGQVLSFVRGGDALVVTSARDVELTVSDGVRSARSRRAVR